MSIWLADSGMGTSLPCGSGWETIEVPAAPDQPDSVFVEDVMVWWQGTAVVTFPGAVQRRGELLGAEAALRDLGADVVHIEPPDTLDGGDVLKVGERFYVGVGGRSSRGACDQLAALLRVEVIPVPTSKVLHLKSAVTALPDGTAVGYLPLVDDATLFETFLAVPEPGAEVVVIDDQTVLMATSAPGPGRSSSSAACASSAWTSASSRSSRAA